MIRPMFPTLDSIAPNNQRILVRADLNVPFKGGTVTDATRLERLAPTIHRLASEGARVIVISHFGRPKGWDESLTLRPVAEELSRVLSRPVAFSADCIGPTAEKVVAEMKNGDVVCLENLRFYEGEEKNDPIFAEALATLAEAYVNDAFSSSHRAHASTVGVAKKLPAYAGLAMQAELEALEKALSSPLHPLVAIVGGAKVSTKLALLENLLTRVDALVIGGAMANTFLAAREVNVGRSLCELDLVATARRIEAKAKEGKCALILPLDVQVAERFEINAPSRFAETTDVRANEMILDVGPQTNTLIGNTLLNAKTVIWNGPLGAFETPPFDAGTQALAKTLALMTSRGLVSIAGGGDTVSALKSAGLEDNALTYVSTAGGAFLEWMEGKTLPGVQILADQARL